MFWILWRKFHKTHSNDNWLITQFASLAIHVLARTVQHGANHKVWTGRFVGSSEPATKVVGSFTNPDWRTARPTWRSPTWLPAIGHPPKTRKMVTLNVGDPTFTKGVVINKQTLVLGIACEQWWWCVWQHEKFFLSS